MRTTKILVCSLLWLSVGCDPSETETLDGQSPDVCDPGKVWTADSVHIHFEGGGSSFEPYGYEADREALRPEQLTALHELCVVPTPQELAADGTFYRIDITDRAGKVTSYRASDYPSLNSAESATRDLPTLQGFRRFQDASPCLLAPGPVNSAPTLNTDPGCVNRAKLPANCAPLAVGFRIDAPGTYTIRTERCRPNLQLSLSDSDKIVNSEAVDPPGCPVLTHTFTVGGTYSLTLSGDSPCSEQGVSNLDLRVTSP